MFSQYGRRPQCVRIASRGIRPDRLLHPADPVTTQRTPQGQVWLALTSAVASAAPAPTPLSYPTTFTDPSGAQQSVSFSGTVSGTSLTGTLTVNGAPEQVTATIGSDGSVSGKLLNADGSQYGVFWGRPNGARSMKGIFDLNACRCGCRCRSRQ